MRAEVEHLLDLHESGYLENPAIEAVASALGGGHELISGDRIVHYTIVHKIGSGGMGESLSRRRWKARPSRGDQAAA
jgi:hypothetical protein